MTASDLMIQDHIDYFKDCIYTAYLELNVSTDDDFHLLKNEALKEADDDIRTEPYNLGKYHYDNIMDLATQTISFHEYMYFKNDWD
jgi:hypothetical protein